MQWLSEFPSNHIPSILFVPELCFFNTIQFKVNHHVPLDGSNQRSLQTNTLSGQVPVHNHELTVHPEKVRGLSRTGKLIPHRKQLVLNAEWGNSDIEYMSSAFSVFCTSSQPLSRLSCKIYLDIIYLAACLHAASSLWSRVLVGLWLPVHPKGRTVNPEIQRGKPCCQLCWPPAADPREAFSEVFWIQQESPKIVRDSPCQPKPLSTPQSCHDTLLYLGIPKLG